MWHMLSSNSKSCTPAHGAQCLWFSVENLIVLNRHTHTQRDRGWAVLTPPLCFAFITLPCHLTLLPYHLISTGLLSPPPPPQWIKEWPSITQSDFPSSSRCSALCCVQSYQEPQASALGALPSLPKPSATSLLYNNSLPFHLQENCTVLQPAENRREQGGPLLLLGPVSWRQGDAQQGCERRKKQPNRGKKGRETLTQSLPKPNPTWHPSLMGHPSMLSLQHILKTIWQLSTGSEEIIFRRFLPAIQKEIAWFHIAPKARE